MARPPRRSGSDKGGHERRRRRRRRLYIVTKHYGDQGSRIYKLNEDNFDSDDAFSEHSGDSGGSSSSSEDSGYTYSDDSCFTDSDDSMDSRYTFFSSDDSGSTSSEESQDHFDSEYDVDSRARRLRHRRLVVRLGKQGERRPEFLAAGTKIISLNASSHHATDVNFAFDAATRVVSAVPPFQSPKKSATFWTAGGAIYALDLNRRDTYGSESSQKELCVFERLCPEPKCRHGRRWRWESLPPPPPFRRNNLYAGLESHAVHPDGATVFLSFYRAGTFSFDGERLEWARHGDGEFLLPFDGEGFYVGELGAWVGLCKMHTGRLAACPVVEHRRRRGGGEAMRCKCGKDVLFRHNWRRHVDANLVYKGGSKFCLLETVTGKHQEQGTSCQILLRVVTFRVQYSFDGELCVVDRRSKVFKLPPHSTGQKPLAFFFLR